MMINYNPDLSFIIRHSSSIIFPNSYHVYLDARVARQSRGLHG